MTGWNDPATIPWFSPSTVARASALGHGALAGSGRIGVLFSFMWLRLKPWVTGAFLAGIVASCLYLVLPIQHKIKLGLDLQGGVSVLLQLR